LTVRAIFTLKADLQKVIVMAQPLRKMEIYEIHYFLAAASSENLQTAAKALSVSPPAISRSISRIEEELGLKLFRRVGRNIVLTPEGKMLQMEVSRLVSLLDDITFRLRPSKKAIPIFLCGTEFGISAALPEVLNRLHSIHLQFVLNVKVLPDIEAVEQAVLDGEAQIGIISGRIFSKKLTALNLGKLQSRTMVGPKHPLYSAAKAGRTVSIEKVLEHEFVSFSQSVLGGSLAYAESGDGWRDDKFPRKIGLKTESIEVALRAIEHGSYLGYLPMALSHRTDVLALEVSGCPYSAKTDAFLLGKNPEDLGWMSKLFRGR
jgi:DNA-binding transcriptional LysR family regulator